METTTPREWPEEREGGPPLILLARESSEVEEKSVTPRLFMDNGGKRRVLSPRFGFFSRTDYQLRKYSGYIVRYALRTTKILRGNRTSAVNTAERISKPRALHVLFLHANQIESKCASRPSIRFRVLYFIFFLSVGIILCIMFCTKYNVYRKLLSERPGARWRRAMAHVLVTRIGTWVVRGDFGAMAQ